jgi:hypothetical protein
MNGTKREKSTDRGAQKLSSFADITADLLKNAVFLLRDEFRMASAEVTRKISKAGKSSTLPAAGAFIAYAGLLFLLAAAVIGISNLIPAGWAALIVGASALIVGGILVIIGRQRLRGDILPRETLDTVKEDTKWMRNQLT